VLSAFPAPEAEAVDLPVLFFCFNFSCCFLDWFLLLIEEIVAVVGSKLSANQWAKCNGNAQKCVPYIERVRLEFLTPYPQFPCAMQMISEQSIVYLGGPKESPIQATSINL